MYIYGLVFIAIIYLAAPEKKSPFGFNKYAM